MPQVRTIADQDFIDGALSENAGRPGALLAILQQVQNNNPRKYLPMEALEYISRRARIPLSRFAKRSVTGLHHRRERWFAQVGDPNHIGIADRPTDINIVVAGGPGIHSLFVPTAFSYRPVTRRIAAKR